MRQCCGIAVSYHKLTTTSGCPSNYCLVQSALVDWLWWDMNPNNHSYSTHHYSWPWSVVMRSTEKPHSLSLVTTCVLHQDLLSSHSQYCHYYTCYPPSRKWIVRKVRKASFCSSNRFFFSHLVTNTATLPLSTGIYHLTAPPFHPTTWPPHESCITWPCPTRPFSLLHQNGPTTCPQPNTTSKLYNSVPSQYRHSLWSCPLHTSTHSP